MPGTKVLFGLQTSAEITDVINSDAVQEQQRRKGRQASKKTNSTIPTVRTFPVRCDLFNSCSYRRAFVLGPESYDSLEAVS